MSQKHATSTQALSVPIDPSAANKQKSEYLEFQDLTRTDNIFEADFIKGLLESDGYHVRIKNQHTASVGFHLAAAIGLTIEVQKEHFEDASNRLKEIYENLEETPKEVYTIKKEQRHQNFLFAVMLMIFPGSYLLGSGHSFLAFLALFAVPFIASKIIPAKILRVCSNSRCKTIHQLTDKNCPSCKAEILTQDQIEKKLETQDKQ